MKKVKGIVISILIAFIGIISMPFSVLAEGDTIPADQFNTNSVIGFNISLRDFSPNTATNQAVFDYVITVTFDDYYICGPVTYTLAYKKLGNSSIQYSSGTFGVNGTSVELSLSTTDVAIDTSQNIYFTKFTYEGTAYTKSSFLQIFPIESFPIQAYNLANNKLVGIDNQFMYQFNMFQIIAQDNMHQFYAYQNLAYKWVFWIDKNLYYDTLTDFVSMPNSRILGVTVLNRFHYEGHTTSLVLVEFTPTSTGGRTFKYIGNETALYMPIFFNLATYQYVSTDFALQFGLTNPFINALENINGNPDSESAASDLDQSTELMQDDFDDMFTIEDQYNQDLNNQIDNIDFTNPLSGNQSLLSSGNFVIQVFNGLIANNPISLLIIIACILLVARRLFG